MRTRVVKHIWRLFQAQTFSQDYVAQRIYGCSEALVTFEKFRDLTLSDPKQTNQTIAEEIGTSGNKEKFVVVKWEHWMGICRCEMRRQAEVGAQTVNQQNSGSQQN